MIEIKKILVPLDLSEVAEHAVIYAEELAAVYGARLHLLHVVDARGMDVTGAVGAPPNSGGLANETIVEAAENGLEQIREAIQGVEAEVVVRVGSPRKDIVAYAKEQEIDVIVMATHGRSGLSHALIGSVAEKVVQTAPCPVLTVRHPEHEFVAA